MLPRGDQRRSVRAKGKRKGARTAIEPGVSAPDVRWYVECIVVYI
jgi:hypothetical protein